MSDDINLKGVVLKPDTGVQDFIKRFGYLLVAVGVAWGGLPIFTHRKRHPLRRHYGYFGIALFYCIGRGFSHAV